MSHSLHHQLVIQTSKEILDIKIDDPIHCQASLPGFAHCVQCRLARTIAVGVRMEYGFHQRIQDHLGHHLRNAIRYRRYPQGAHLPIPFGNLYQSHRRRKIAPRRHPIPDLIKVALEIPLEHRQSFPIHPGGATVGLHQLPCSQDKFLGNTIRLCFRHAFLPFRVDPFLKPVGSAPSLHPSYRASSLLRADPPLRSALVL